MRLLATVFALPWNIVVLCRALIRKRRAERAIAALEELRRRLRDDG
jgi:hypothetical protein